MSVESNTLLEVERHVEPNDEVQHAPLIEQKEIKRTDWDFELTNFVAANEHMIVECPWEPGTEMTLSAVTLGWPYAITEENVDSVLSQLKALVEQASLALEDLEEELIPLVVDEVETAKIDDKAGTVVEQPEKKHGTSKQKQPSKSPISEQITLPETTLPAPIEFTPQELPIPPLPSMVTNLLKAPKETPREQLAAKPVKIEKVKERSLKAHKPGVVQILKKTARSQQAETIKPILGNKHAVQPAIKIETTPAPIILRTLNEAPVELTTEANPAIITKTAKNDQNESSPSPESLFSANQRTLEILADTIETSDDETAEIAHEILADIIQATKTEHTPDADDVSRVKEEVTELLAELFDTLEITYDTDMLEAISKLVATGRFMQEFEEILAGKEHEYPQGDRVAAAIRQAVTSAPLIQQLSERINVLGKSALKHFGLRINEPAEVLVATTAENFLVLRS